MKFSERKNFIKPSNIIQTDGMNDELRNSLWNVFDIIIWNSQSFTWTSTEEAGIEVYSKILWFKFFKKPIDMVPRPSHRILPIIRTYYFACNWYEGYAFIEF